MSSKRARKKTRERHKMRMTGREKDILLKRKVKKERDIKSRKIDKRNVKKLKKLVLIRTYTTVLKRMVIDKEKRKTK